MCWWIGYLFFSLEYNGALSLRSLESLRLDLAWLDVLP